VWEMKIQLFYPLNIDLRNEWTATASSDMFGLFPGNTNGLPIHAIDGNLNTSWSSRYGTGAFVDPPHTISFDMKRLQTFQGITITLNSTFTNIKSFKIEVSHDGSTWTAINDGNLFTLDRVSTPQT